MRTFRLTALIIAATAASAAFAQAPTRTELARTSWGKAGVSLAEYRADAIACATQAMNLDFSETNVAKTLVAASRAIDNAYSSAWMEGAAGFGQGIAVYGVNIGQLVHTYRIDDQFAAVANVQYETLGTCLAGRGYHRFRLTDDQQHALRHLHRGSDARRAYLHSLASDPAVLTSQAM